MILLSILIPTITTRAEPFNKLKAELERQVQEAGIVQDVEIREYCDDRTMSIGNKRQALLEAAQGLFVVFIDDDDWIPEDYCSTLVAAIKQNPSIDCIGFLQQCTFDGGAPKSASLSARWDDWADNHGGFDYVRTTFFPTPVRRYIALQIGYRDLRFGEDHDFARRLKQSGLIKNEYFIDRIMYYYQYTSAPYADKYGTVNT
jgi:glycosyltransferase involved in cell wall biosynthesis